MTTHFVPTMGALHAGHAALIRAARKEADRVVVSVFVNPLQFNDPSDLERYPRTLEADETLARDCGADDVWAPTVDEIYPPGEELEPIHVPGVGDDYEGAFRPGHFDGVATVVARLFQHVKPRAAWFGRKDAQQLALIRALVRQLGLRIDIRDHPTVREPDGLALSSRNRLLSASDRSDALRLSRGLFAAADLAEAGERASGALENACGERLEYAALVDADTFQPVHRLSPGRSVLVVAGHAGPVRLIDNIPFEVTPGGDCRADRGVRIEELT